MMDTTDTNKLTEVKPGIVYLSRIPPSMNPLKVKNLLSQFGEVDRLFLQPEGKKDFFLFFQYREGSPIGVLLSVILSCYVFISYFYF